MRKIKMIIAVFVSVISLSSYLKNTYFNNDIVVVSLNDNLIVEQGIKYDGELLIPYQKYTNNVKSDSEIIITLVDSLKGSLLSKDAKVLNTEISEDTILLEVNEFFFKDDETQNIKICEFLNYLRKLFGNKKYIKIYCENIEIKDIPFTNISVNDISKLSINSLKNKVGKPIILIENNIIYTDFIHQNINLELLNESFCNSYIYDTFTILDNFVDDYSLNDKILSLYLNDVLQLEESFVNENILSDYLVILFLNFDINQIKLYLNNEEYYYRGMESNIVNLSDIVYNLHQ